MARFNYLIRRFVWIARTWLEIFNAFIINFYVLLLLFIFIFLHAVGAYEVAGRVFGVFTSGVDGAFAGSAICSFTGGSIDEVFAGKFAEYTGSGGKGEQPVPEESEPRPRPGSCGHDTTQLPDSTVNFIRYGECGILYYIILYYIWYVCKNNCFNV